MSEELNHGLTSPETMTCANCLFHYFDRRNQTDKCARFARFVDYVLTDVGDSCSYWTDRNDI